MKRILVMVLALVLLLSAAACGKSPAPSSDGTSAPSTSTPDQSGSSDSSTPPASGGSDSSAPDSGKTGSCSDIADFYEKLVDRMEKKVMDLQDEHNEAVGDDYTKMINLWYMPFSSLRYIDAFMFNANTSASTVQSSLRLLGNEDAVVTGSGNEYTITYTNTDWYTETDYELTEIIRFDPDALALSVVNYRDGEISSFTEFQALGNDRYALSSELERAIVTYKDGEILTIDHAENKYDTDYETGDYEAYSFIFGYDSIFGRTDLDSAWVTEAEASDGLYRHYEYSDGVCTITGLNKQHNWDGGDPTFTPGYEVIMP